jgi:hypothetical protein
MFDLRNYLDSFASSRLAAPSDLKLAIGELPVVGEFPSPWATWTLIELVRYRRRQIWAEGLVGDRLPHLAAARSEAITVGFDPSSPEWEDSEEIEEGYVPGSPDWGYAAEPRLDYCNLTERVTGEVINVVLSSRGGAGTYCFISELIRSWERRNAHGACARLLQLHPSLVTVHLAIDELTRSGLLEEVLYDEPTDCYAERLSPDVVARCAEIEHFVEAWEGGRNRLWLAAIIGDWPAAHAAAIESGHVELIAMTEPRADLCRSRRIASLRQRLSEGYWKTAHAALNDLGVDLPDDVSPSRSDQPE